VECSRKVSFDIQVDGQHVCLHFCVLLIACVAMYSALARLAIKQNEIEWWDSVKDDEKELAQVKRIASS
jgi:hypothetical protein